MKTPLMRRLMLILNENPRESASHPMTGWTHEDVRLYAVTR